MTARVPRIVSLLPSATEIVCALGLIDSLVGVTHECDYPSGVESKPRLTASRISRQTMNSAEIDHAIRSQLDGHGCIYDLDEVQLRSLAPELILTQELCKVCAVNYQTVVQAARTLDTDVTVVSLEPTTIADIGIVRLSMSWVLWVVRTRLWLRRWPGQAVVGKATISFQMASRISISRR